MRRSTFEIERDFELCVVKLQPTDSENAEAEYHEAAAPENLDDRGRLSPADAFRKRPVIRHRGRSVESNRNRHQRACQRTSHIAQAERGVTEAFVALVNTQRDVDGRE